MLFVAKDGDAERKNDHLTGKSCMGYAKIRAKVRDFQDQVRAGKIRRGAY